LKISITHSMIISLLIITIIILFVPVHSYAQYNIKIAAHIVHSTNLGISGISEGDITTSLQQINNIYTNNNTNITFTLVSIDYLDDDNFVYVVRGGGPVHSQQAQNLFDIFNQPGVLHVIFVPQLDHHGVALSIPGRKVIMANGSATNNESLAHEVGHCFGLFHTYHGQENVTRNTGSNYYNATTAGDFLHDTRADPMNDINKLNTFLENCVFTNPL
jgi:hypothetical protein